MLFMHMTLLAQDPIHFQTEIIPKNKYELSIVEVFPEEFPIVSVVFQAKNLLEDPLKLLKKEDLEVKENGLWAEVISLRNITEKQPIKISVIIDKSSSMLSGPDEGSVGFVPPINYAKSGIKKFIEDEDLEMDHIQLIGFNDKVNQVTEFTNKKGDLLKELSKVKAQGGTAFYDAVEQAVNSLSKIKDGKAIIALTDGMDNSSHISLKEIVTHAQSAHIPIYAIGLGGADRSALDSLTKSTSGFSYFTNDPEKLAEIYLKIKRQIRSVYELKYQSQALDNVGDTRNVEVRFTNKELSFSNPNFEYELPEKAKTYLIEHRKARNQRLMLLGGGVLIVMIGATAFLLTRKKKAKIVKIYPNPVEIDVTINYFIPASVQSPSLQVFDSSGNQFRNMSLDAKNEQVTIPASDWPVGTYYFCITTSKGKTAMKRVIKR